MNDGQFEPALDCQRQGFDNLGDHMLGSDKVDVVAGRANVNFSQTIT